MVRSTRTKPRWRLLLPGTSVVPEDIASLREGEALWNMAFDSVLSEWNAIRDTGTSLPTLRLYFWQRPAVTVGRFQNVERTVYMDNCRSLDIPIVRRVTGGRGILHGDDLTFSLACSVTDLGMVPQEAVHMSAVYARLSDMFIAAFAAVGVTCAIGGGAFTRGEPNRGDCFADATPADIVERISGRKLLGTALHRSDHRVLQQGTIPVGQSNRRWDMPLFRGGGSRTLDKPDGVEWDGDRLASALVEALESRFGASMDCGGATQSEITRTRERVIAERTNPLWNVRVHGQPAGEGLD